MTRAYLGISKKLYKHQIAAKAADYVMKYFADNGIAIKKLFNPATDFDELGIAIPGNITGAHEKEQYIQYQCLDLALRKSDIFVYMNTFTKMGNVSFTPGVRGEIDFAIKHKKKIYRILLSNTGDIDTTEIIGMKEISVESIDEEAKKLYAENSPENQGWVLKTLDDYRKLYQVQPTMLEYLYKQCYDPELLKIGVSGILGHRSLIYEMIVNETNVLTSCHDHNWRKHAYANPMSQIFETYCPYTLTSKLFHERIFEGIPKYPEDIGGMERLIMQNRVLHKLMYIYDEKVHKIGVCLRNSDGVPVIIEGKLVPDPKLIKGVQIVIDLDIKKRAKDAGFTFFHPAIYDEYVRAMKLLVERMTGNVNDTKSVKIMFSGNGAYLILRKYINFAEKGVLNYRTHEVAWEIMRKGYEKLLEDNKIRHLQIEQGYGWNRYFKLAFTPHASKERVSIPLNADEMLNNPEYIKYIDKNSMIVNLMNKVVESEDILKDSGWET